MLGLSPLLSLNARLIGLFCMFYARIWPFRGPSQHFPQTFLFVNYLQNMLICREFHTFSSVEAFLPKITLK